MLFLAPVNDDVDACLDVKVPMGWQCLDGFLGYVDNLDIETAFELVIADTSVQYQAR